MVLGLRNVCHGCAFIGDMLLYSRNHFQLISSNRRSPKTIKHPVVKQKSTADNMLGAVGNAATGNTDIQLKLPSGNNFGSSSEWDSNDVNSLQNTPQAKMDASIPQIQAGSRMAPSEAGRAERKEFKKNILPVSSLSLKNIPEKYKLLSQDNSVANQTNYYYQTDDGSESINITLISSPAQEQAIVSEADTSKEITSDRLMMTATPAAVENISREIRVEDQMISVQLSGNICSAELANLADKIVICSAPQ